jgi:bile acid:Na+ symporter, BASS family
VLLAAQAAEALALQLPPGALIAVNLTLAVIMFGVAIDLDLDEMRRTLRRPVGPAIGLATQFLALPALSVGLIAILDPPPGIALGMLVVATAPGGSVSNIVTHLAGANTSLSITMTGASSLVALVLTPLNLAFWGPRVAAIQPILRQVHLDPVHVVGGLLLLLGLPLTLGILLQVRRPATAARLVAPLRVAAVVGLFVLVLGAVVANLGTLVTSLQAVLVAVVAHNALALVLGYGMATAARLPVRDRRAISLEVGIQNSALSLALVVTFFGGLGGAALVAAFWGAWHVIIGLALAWTWSGQPLWRPRLPAEG